VLAFVAVLVAGLAGGLIGYGFVDTQCTGSCSTPSAIGAAVGAVLAAIGTAIVAVLVLRAMGEWRRIQDDRDRPRPGPPA
jgi:NhaP-type Na+/H+ or K+/H+ antiporter